MENMKEKNNTKIIVLAILGAAVLVCIAIVTTGIITSRRSNQTGGSEQNAANQQIISDIDNDLYGDNEEYDELSSMSKDQQILSNITTDIVSSLAQSGAITKSTTVELSDLGDIVDSYYSREVVETFLQLTGYTSMDDFIASLSFKSETANDFNGAAGKVFIESTADSGRITTFMTENHDMNGTRIEGLTVEAE